MIAAQILNNVIPSLITLMKAFMYLHFIGKRKNIVLYIWAIPDGTWRLVLRKNITSLRCWVTNMRYLRIEYIRSVTQRFMAHRTSIKLLLRTLFRPVPALSYTVFQLLPYYPEPPCSAAMFAYSATFSVSLRVPIQCLICYCTTSQSMTSLTFVSSP